MELFLIGHDYKYASEQIMLMMFPQERPTYPTEPSGALRAEIAITHGARYATAVCRITDPERGAFSGRAAVSEQKLNGKVERDRWLQRAVKLAFYRAAVRLTGQTPPWGAVTGVRPGKLLRQMLEQTGSEKAAVREMMRSCSVSRERAELCMDAVRAALDAEKRLSTRDVCLYIGIPFCPTRCAYCSFVSQTVERSFALLEPFVEALLRDIEATAAAVREAQLRPAALYMGGGTPTTLSPEQLDRVLAALRGSFDLSACRELTVEAGRPDTVTAEKLTVLKKWGVTRVSVNPQTMSDTVLEAIGRRHTAQDVVRAVELVRSAGGLEINMDMIAGLPADSFEGFAASLDTVMALEPENITVHTLALKKGSRIMLEGESVPSAETVGRMLDFASLRLRGSGFAPYYLYRQKYMSGGFENVGWTLPDKENLYNICIMEELRSIVSMGGGASTKLIDGDGRVERFFAPKYPLEYIQRIDKICADKSKIKEFYK
ncbi:MAG: coproporphyrinogen dehydrogenase HemZ [Oscillospiraceae bacterium]|nr:coproporphyrinogen dehydrogenase HemZ [Oscillospiraceae bacterium]